MDLSITIDNFLIDDRYFLTFKSPNGDTPNLFGFPSLGKNVLLYD